MTDFVALDFVGGCGVGGLGGSGLGGLGGCIGLGPGLAPPPVTARGAIPGNAPAESGPP